MGWSPGHRRIRLAVVAVSLSVAALLSACGGGGESLADQGRATAQDVGCLSCHSTGTDDGLGPALGGIWNEERTFTDGSTGVVDEDYLRRSILDPDSQVVDGFQPIMPQVHLSDEEFEGVVAYVREVAGG